MATIKPFHGVRYNMEVVGTPSRVISQPYDRVRYGLQEQYYALSPYNVVRVIKGQERPDDDPDQPQGPNVYTRARDYYKHWRASGVLVEESQPALYVYHQTFTVDGEKRTRKGFVAAFVLSPFGEGIVLPHERTHAGPKVDRLRLTRNRRSRSNTVFRAVVFPRN